MRFPRTHRLVALFAVTAMCPLSTAKPSDTVVNFDSDRPGASLATWRVEGTNQQGPPATWQVVPDTTAPSGPNALALTKTNHDSSSTFNLCWTDQIRFREGTIEVAFKAVAGEEDQGGGPIWR